jgi:uncharacterized protein YqjF (DUF2071 family)
LHPLLESTAHRPWPLPAGRWIMRQTWHDLLFAHWPIDPQRLRALLPPQLPLDLFEGTGWLTLAPFHMSGIRARGLPAMARFSRFPELNVRTYVTRDGKPGVFFFSLDAASLAAVRAARALYRLPYFHARMSVTEKDGWVAYWSDRRNSPAEFRGRYRPVAPVRLREPGTLAHWLSERYCLYTVAKERVFRAEIHHEQWPLQDAELELDLNTMLQASRISPPAQSPLLHFSKKLEVLIWMLREIK